MTVIGNQGRAKSSNGDLKAEYDFSSMKGGVRGKYLDRLKEGNDALQPDGRARRKAKRRAVPKVARR